MLAEAVAGCSRQGFRATVKERGWRCFDPVVVLHVRLSEVLRLTICARCDTYFGLGVWNHIMYHYFFLGAKMVSLAVMDPFQEGVLLQAHTDVCISCSTQHTQVAADEFICLTILVGRSDCFFAVETDPGNGVEVCRSNRVVAWSGHLRLVPYRYFGGAKSISISVLTTT